MLPKEMQRLGERLELSSWPLPVWKRSARPRAGEQLIQRYFTVGFAQFALIVPRVSWVQPTVWSIQYQNEIGGEAHKGIG